MKNSRSMRALALAIASERNPKVLTDIQAFGYGLTSEELTELFISEGWPSAKMTYRGRSVPNRIDETVNNWVACGQAVRLKRGDTTLIFPIIDGASVGDLNVESLDAKTAETLTRFEEDYPDIATWADLNRRKASA